MLPVTYICTKILKNLSKNEKERKTLLITQMTSKIVFEMIKNNSYFLFVIDISDVDCNFVWKTQQKKHQRLQNK